MWVCLVGVGHGRVTRERGERDVRKRLLEWKMFSHEGKMMEVGEGRRALPGGISSGVSGM